jgi:hypothetical protein
MDAPQPVSTAHVLSTLPTTFGVEVSAATGTVKKLCWSKVNGNKNVVGIDIAEPVFQLHSIDMETGEFMRLLIKRGKFLEHFANRSS